MDLSFNFLWRSAGGSSSTVGPRLIYINRFQQTKYCSNQISTAKYNLISFLPRFLFEQFRRYANIFFLFIALLQQIPDVSPTGRYTTAIPLLCILSVSAVKEIIEDLKRHRADGKVNHSKVFVLRCGHWIEESWQSLQVGDIVKVVAGQFFPADLVLLSSSEPSAMSYIETANLDGETNLKMRQGLSQTAHLLAHDDLYQFTGSIECEAPNCHLYEFTGTIYPDNNVAVPLGPDQLLLRGAQLRNTNWIFGIVIYTGHESKLMLNSVATPLKRSNVDRVTNSQILILFMMLMVMSLVSAIAAQMWNNEFSSIAWYLGFKSSTTSQFGLNFLTFIILYNNLIPISLQVTLEMDLDMYYAPTDQPAMARTSNLNEELGQVKYIFSDKTGTLTRNVMCFKKCSIGGVLYGTDIAEKFEDATLLQNLNSRHITASVIRDFMTLLAVCHTVVPDKQTDGEQILYQASSPDEGALVRGARDVGFVFHTRTPDSVIIDSMNKKERYEILHVLEFTSDRKRMSVVVRCPNGKLKLLIKGADSAIFERLAPNQLYSDVTLSHLEDFAASGYRTLCIAKAEISDEFYASWCRSYYDASITLEDREKKLSDVAELIEQNLVLLGATAIEDKLQEGVPDAIASLLRADIKVWVLTGDKQETAINIGYSSRLISQGMPLLIINKETLGETTDSITRYLLDLGSHVGQENDMALIINGKSLKYALSVEARKDFLQLAISCRVVICCRVTPMQKAEVVELVKRNVSAITLAVGDGANDVAMIQAAHVGVGISGVEGLQAACASDYAVAQFRFLTKLLFVHGAWSYHRMVKLILYSFHKNICLYIIEFWFATVTAFSGQPLFERWCIGLYNVAFTAAPPLVIGLFDRTATAETMIKFPALYKLSQNKESFNIKVFWLWIINATYHSVLLFWLTKISLSQGISWSDGRDGGWLMLGNCVYTYVVVTVCLKGGLEIDAWTWLTHLAIWGSIASWFFFLVVYSNFWPMIPMASEMSGMETIVFSSGVFWFGLLLIPALSLLVDVVYKIVRRTLFKSLADEVRELEMRRIDPSIVLPKLQRKSLTSEIDNAPGQDCLNSISVSLGCSFHADRRLTASEPNVSCSEISETARLLKTVFKRSVSGIGLAEEAQHGFAFSQEEQTQEKIIRAYDSTKSKPEGL